MSSPSERNGRDTPSQNTTTAQQPRRSRASYPRKRALTACETCRKRKIKCDNSRPTCGACLGLGIACTFQEPRRDHSTYDLASLEILERVNYVARLLESRHNAAPSSVSTASPSTRPDPDTSAASYHAEDSPFVAVHSFPRRADHVAVHSSWLASDGLVESLEFTGRSPGSCEQVLSWPIFGGHFDHARITSLIFNPDAGQRASVFVSRQFSSLPGPPLVGARPVRASGLGRGVWEHDVLSLVNQFLINVHIKNPVLDPGDLKQKAKWVAENGFGWDATSCLLATVCALATVSSGFSPDPVTPDIVGSPVSLNSVADAHDYTTAESYYVTAQKRVGLLDSSVEACQCWFLLGVYEMYSLRPAKAWTSFHRACVALQVYLQGRRGKEAQASEALVCRLYWSCLKSECELRMEIQIPSSGLASVAYPDVFPTPPEPARSDGMEGIALSSTGSAVETLAGPEPDLEKIWSYYLSELAVRKIGNRIMNCFYRDSEGAWLTTSLDRMIRVAEELELQMTQWFENIPNALTALQGSETYNKLATEELNFVLHARLSDLRERIYRPFLYLAVHPTSDDAVQQAVRPYAQRCVDACLAHLARGTPRHRHHGSWFENRSMFLKSLLILAAVKSGRIYVPDVWRQGVELCVAGFKFWDCEAPDLRESRLVLLGLMESLEEDL